MQTPSISQVLSIALAHHQAGRLAEAEQLYRQILSQSPDEPDALHLLGMLANQMGRCDVAIGLIQRAIEIRPGVANYYNSLGMALNNLARPEQALGALAESLRRDPGAVDVHVNMANAYRMLRRFDEAIDACRSAIGARPTYAVAHIALGNALLDHGDSEPAAAAFREALKHDLNSAIAHHNLGVALQALGQEQPAMEAYRSAVRIDPAYFDAYNNLGGILSERGNFAEAVEAFRSAIQIRPGAAGARSNLGNALIGLSRMDEAIARLREAIAIDPGFAESHVHLGNALSAAGRTDDAIDSFQTARRINPKSLQAQNNLGSALLDQGDVAGAIAAYTAAVELAPASSKAGIHSNILLAMHYQAETTPESLYREHRRWAQLYAEPLRPAVLCHANIADPQRRLRIGYISPDFRSHVVARFLHPLLSHRDRSAFEIICYSDVSQPDETTARIREASDLWRSIDRSPDEQVAQQISTDGIDILVDLTLHASRNRMLVFARKPSPVQISYLSYCSTSGMDQIDYRITDPYLDPPGTDESVYSERTLRLPESYWCYEPPLMLETGQSPAKSNGFVTFGCMNNFCKVTPAALAVWARILAEVEGSQLLLHAHLGRHRLRVQHIFESAGVDSRRITFLDYSSAEGYFARYRSIDIVLDTFPFNGGTTTCDSLWMSVPVVSLAGSIPMGRAGASLLSNVGLESLVARSETEYADIAATLARDLPRLEDLHRNLRPRMEASPLMDAVGFTRNMEAAYRTVWRRWCGGAGRDSSRHPPSP